MNAHGIVHKYGDHVDTDVIIPARYLNTQSHKELASHCMEDIDKDFIHRVKDGDIMVAGVNFGCGSSREHAALAPLYLGVKAVITKSFARIHAANLINAGILPLTFADPADYDKLAEGDEIVLSDIFAAVEAGSMTLTTKAGDKIKLDCAYSPRQIAILKAGGLLPYTKSAK